LPVRRPGGAWRAETGAPSASHGRRPSRPGRAAHPVEVGLPVSRMTTPLCHSDTVVCEWAAGPRGLVQRLVPGDPAATLCRVPAARDVHLQIGLSASYHHRPSDPPRLVEQRAHRPGQVKGWVGSAAGPAPPSPWPARTPRDVDGVAGARVIVCQGGDTSVRPYPSPARAWRQAMRRHRYDRPPHLPAPRTPQGSYGEYRLSTGYSAGSSQDRAAFFTPISSL
jgi:hypothetical protein